MNIHAMRLSTVCREIYMRTCERELVQMQKQEVCEELLQLKKKHHMAFMRQSEETKEKIFKYRDSIDQRIRKEQSQDRLNEWADIALHYWDNTECAQ